jgi:hypothetical protein
MNPGSNPDQIQEDQGYDDRSFVKPKIGPYIGPKEPAEANDFPANESHGFNFQPFTVQHRDFHINALPLTPLELFQLFVPKRLLWKWIEYTNS